ncbi:MAG: putative cytokinetic ring protein SteA [Bacillota bacterium]
MTGAIVKGTVKKDKRTKNLARRLKPGDIALLDHKDLDEVAARTLAGIGVSAVLNVAPSISGRYPALGASVLVDAGIPLYDNLGPHIWDMLQDGDQISIEGSELKTPMGEIAIRTPLTKEEIMEKAEQASARLNEELRRFLENTLEYAAKEKDFIFRRQRLPNAFLPLKGRDVVVVVRGPEYKSDLMMIRAFIREQKPVLIGVDGGADALLEMGLTPHIIVGDMDSVSDSTLSSGASLVVHAYLSGTAPGLERLKKLGMSCEVYPSPGTSEDVALLLSYEAGAKLIVAVGTHSNIVDFLEKGRPGMASTLLVRMKVGQRLVDAKGVNRLYCPGSGIKNAALLVAASFVPALLIGATSPQVRQLLRLILLRLKIALGV